MAQGAKRAVAAIAIQLGKASEVVYHVCLALAAHAVRPRAFFAQPPLLRPHGTHTAPVVLPLSGEKDKHLVNLSVAIPVVGRPVGYRLLHVFHRIDHQLAHLLVVAPVVGAAIVGRGMVQVGHPQVEREQELSVALVAEIVAHRPYELPFAEVVGIENPVPQLERSLVCKLGVGVFGQYHQLTAFAFQRGLSASGSRSLPALCLSCSLPLHPGSPAGSQLHEPPVGTELHLPSVARDIAVPALVAHKRSLNQ